MLAWLGRLFSPPRFQDEEKTRVAGILNIILFAFIAILGILLALEILLNPGAWFRFTISVMSAIVLLALILLALARRGRVRASSLVFVCFAWGGLTAPARPGRWPWCRSSPKAS